MNMQRNVKAIATGLGLISTLLTSGMATAQEFSVPHSFVAGERAQAAQVNQNFTATAGAINENSAALSGALEQIAALERAVAALQANTPSPGLGGMPVYSQGVFIGNFLDENETALLLSPRGYLFHATMIDYHASHILAQKAWLRQQEIYFADANCMGDAYVDVEPRFGHQDEPYLWEVEHGLVLRDGPVDVSETRVYYVPRSANGVLQSYNSVGAPGACSLEAGERVLWQALPNDETVTGVPDAPYAKPFSLGLP